MIEVTLWFFRHEYVYTCKITTMKTEKKNVVVNMCYILI